MRKSARLFAAVSLSLGATAPLAAQTPTVTDTVQAPTDLSATAAASRAAAGDPAATATMGWLYESGRGVAADARRAETFYRSAARKDDGFAKWRLGVMIDQGLAEGSPAEAVALFREAIAAKTAGAASSLGVMYATGRGVSQDFDAAMRYYQAAARMGNAHGLEGIGVLYANGQGVDRDMAEALAHWLVAAAAGDDDAMALLIEHMPPSSSPDAAPIYARANQIADAYGNVMAGDARTATLSR